MKHDKPSSKQRIEHILESIKAIQTFTKGYSQEMFERDSKVYYACLYQFAVIGEAVVHIDNEILEAYTYPWYKVKSFRNFIMHEYHAIDEQLIWDTIQGVLPEFMEIIEHILKNEFGH